MCVKYSEWWNTYVENVDGFYSYYCHRLLLRDWPVTLPATEYRNPWSELTNSSLSHR